MKIIRRLAAGLAGIIFMASVLRPREIEEELFSIQTLAEFDLRPGPWFESYLCDWMLAFNVWHPDHATSGIARGAESGDYIWATATPEWDLHWFNAHGWKFPRKWVSFEYLASSEGEPGGPCMLRGL